MSAKKVPKLETFNPWKVHHVRGSMGYSVTITYDGHEPFTPARTVDLAPVADLSYSEAVQLADMLAKFFAKQPRCTVRPGEYMRRELLQYKKQLANHEASAAEMRSKIERLRLAIFEPAKNGRGKK